MNRNEDRNAVIRHRTDEELEGVSGGVTVVEVVLRAAALMRGIAYPCLSMDAPVTIKEGYICGR